MNTAEATAARVVAVFALERFIRERSAIAVWASTGIAALLWVGAVMSDGLGAIIVALFALVASAVAATLVAVRNLVLRGVRRVAGGRNYERLRPLIAKRFDEVQSAKSAIPVDTIGILRLAWIARRPRALRDHVREVADTMVRTIPEVVADVRRELDQSPIDI